MSPINRITFRIIGLFALIAGIIYFSISISELSELTTVKDVITQFISLAVNCVVIYGGYHLLKVKEIGRRLVIIWSCCQLPSIVFVVFGLAYNSVFPGNFQVGFPSQAYAVLSIGFYLFCAFALIYLLVNKISKDVFAEEYWHWHLVATLLSLFTPGLGRALVGNLFVGMILFYVYGLMMTAKVGFNNDPAYLNWVGQFLYYLVVWKILSAIDWSAVKGFENSEQTIIDSAPDLTSGQVNGG